MSEQTHPRPKYGAIFIGLFVLTVIEIIVATAGWPRLMTVLLLVALAVAKALMVAMFYMHLRFEKVLLVYIAVVPFLFSIILTVGIGFDLAHP